MIIVLFKSFFFISNYKYIFYYILYYFFYYIYNIVDIFSFSKYLNILLKILNTLLYFKIV